MNKFSLPLTCRPEPSLVCPLRDGQQLLFRLMDLLQRHRGMRAGLLAGDSGFAEEIGVCTAHIDPLILQLGASPGLYAFEAEEFVTHWYALLAATNSISELGSFARHSALIERLLSSLQQSGQATPDFPCNDQTRKRHQGNLWLRLPALAELLGKLRGLGTGAIARGHCEHGLRVRMMFLLARAESLFSLASTSKCRATNSSKVEAALRQLAWVVRTDILSSGRCRLSASAYFALGSAVIDQVFFWIGDSANALTELASA